MWDFDAYTDFLCLKERDQCCQRTVMECDVLMDVGEA